MIRMIDASAFVPLRDVILAFNALFMHCGANGNEQVILQYSERNYIGDLRAGVRIAPAFPHELWSVHDRVMSGLPRTANAVEAWHCECWTMSCNNLEIHKVLKTRACFE